MIPIIDALSVYAAITAAYIKIPSDNGTLMHVQYMRELLDTKVVHSLIWSDTRDMCADGMTKGTVDRMLLDKCMQGTSEVNHQMKVWHPKSKLTGQELSSIGAT